MQRQKHRSQAHARALWISFHWFFIASTYQKLLRSEFMSRCIQTFAYTHLFIVVWLLTAKWLLVNYAAEKRGINYKQSHSMKRSPHWGQHMPLFHLIDRFQLLLLLHPCKTFHNFASFVCFTNGLFPNTAPDIPWHGPKHMAQIQIQHLCSWAKIFATIFRNQSQT